MGRLLFLIAIVFMVFLLIRSYRKKNAPRQDKPVVDDMVRCAQCGVHLPKGESIQTDGQFFCSIEHRDAYRK